MKKNINHQPRWKMVFNILNAYDFGRRNVILSNDRRLPLSFPSWHLQCPNQQQQQQQIKKKTCFFFHSSFQKHLQNPLASSSNNLRPTWGPGWKKPRSRWLFNLLFRYLLRRHGDGVFQFGRCLVRYRNDRKLSVGNCSHNMFTFLSEYSN